LGWLSGIGGGLLDFEVNKRIGAKLEQPTKDIHSLQVDLARIGSKLDTFIDLEKERLKSLANLRGATFGRALPQVADALSDAVKLGIQTPQEVVDSLQRNLLSTPQDRPDYWNAAAALITYRSGARSEILPRCLDKKPVIKLAEPMDEKQTTMKITPAIYENCEIQLDDPKANLVYLETLQIANLELRHCKVSYGGGALFFPAHTIGGGPPRTIVFVECTFEMLVPSPPPESGRRLIAGLLAAENPKNASVVISRT
jgi:hypothetical protein